MCGPVYEWLFGIRWCLRSSRFPKPNAPGTPEKPAEPGPGETVPGAKTSESGNVKPEPTEAKVEGKDAVETAEGNSAGVTLKRKATESEAMLPDAKKTASSTTSSTATGPPSDAGSAKSAPSAKPVAKPDPKPPAKPASKKK